MRSKGAVLIAMAALSTACVSPQLVRRESTGDVAKRNNWAANITPFGSPNGATIAPAVAGSTVGQVNGIATVAPAANNQHFTAELRLSGLAGSSYSWHISPGTCGASDEAAVGTTANYPVVTIAPNGTGSATAIVGSAAPSTGNFFVIVREANGAGVALACGNLKQIIP